MSGAPPGGVDFWWQLSGWDDHDPLTIVSPEERRRAEGMVPEAAERFLRSRSLLRRVLSLYLDREPRDLAFSSRCRRCGHRTHGKPALVGGGVEFSLSRSRGATAVAVSRRPVGVDLECAAAAPSLDAVARVAIESDQQRARLEKLPPELEQREILAAWTLKEAYLKGIGAGLVIGPEEVECRPVATRRWRSVHCRHRDAAAGWWVRPIGDEPGFVAALAVPSQPTNVRVLRFESNQSLSGSGVREP